jgi:hypothetical protein
MPMSKIAKEMRSLAVSRLVVSGSQPVGKMACLVLQITPPGARLLVLLAIVGGKRSEIGLDAHPDTSCVFPTKKYAFRVITIAVTVSQISRPSESVTLSFS